MPGAAQPAPQIPSFYLLIAACHRHTHLPAALNSAFIITLFIWAARKHKNPQKQPRAEPAKTRAVLPPNGAALITLTAPRLPPLGETPGAELPTQRFNFFADISLSKLSREGNQLGCPDKAASPVGRTRQNPQSGKTPNSAANPTRQQCCYILGQSWVAQKLLCLQTAE